MRNQTTPGDRGGKSKNSCAEGTRDRIWKNGSGSVTRSRNQSGRIFLGARSGRSVADLRPEKGNCGRSKDSGEGKISEVGFGKKEFRSEDKSAFEGERVGEESIYRGERKWNFQFYP